MGHAFHGYGAACVLMLLLPLLRQGRGTGSSEGNEQSSGSVATDATWHETPSSHKARGLIRREPLQLSPAGPQELSAEPMPTRPTPGAVNGGDAETSAIESDGNGSTNARQATMQEEPNDAEINRQEAHGDAAPRSDSRPAGAAPNMNGSSSSKASYSGALSFFKSANWIGADMPSTPLPLRLEGTPALQTLAVYALLMSVLVTMLWQASLPRFSRESKEMAIRSAEKAAATEMLMGQWPPISGDVAETDAGIGDTSPNPTSQVFLPQGACPARSLLEAPPPPKTWVVPVPVSNQD